MATVVLGLLQHACGVDPVANLGKALRMAAVAADRGAQVICTQELFRSPYFCQSEDYAAFGLAEPVPGPPARICWAGRAWRRSTQVRTVRMSVPSMAAAWSSGAISAWARSVQWVLPPRETDAADAEPTSTSEWAMARAPVHSVHDWIGDHRSLREWRPWSVDPVGSNSQVRPMVERAAAVASSTSGFVDVETTAPLAASTFGMTSDVVFPDRGGPMIITECPGGTKRQPCRSPPRKMPWLASRDALNATRSGDTGCCADFGEEKFVTCFSSRHRPESVVGSLADVASGDGDVVQRRRIILANKRVSVHGLFVETHHR